MKKLPLGLEVWTPRTPENCGTAGVDCNPLLNWWDYLLQYLPALPGLFITATAALFGAPFWFDILQRLIQLRGTGTKPPTEKDKSTTKSAATP